MKKLTLEERISNIENRIQKFETILVNRDLNNVVNEEDKNNDDPVSYKVLNRFYRAIMDDADPAGLDSVIKACFNKKTSNKEILLLLILLKAITMYRADKQ